MLLRMGLRAYGSSTIRYGALSIPVKLYTAVDETKGVFRQVHKGCGLTLRRETLCPKHGALKNEDIGKGYEVARDQIWEVPEPVLAELASTPKEIALIGAFTRLPYAHVAKTIYVGPDHGGEHAYSALAEALERAEKFILAFRRDGTGDTLVAMTAHLSRLVMHELHYAEHIRKLTELELPNVEATSKDAVLMGKLINALTIRDFSLSRYHDEALEKLNGHLTALAQGKKGVPVRRVTGEPAQIIDLSRALEQSLELAEKRNRPRHRTRSAGELKKLRRA